MSSQEVARTVILNAHYETLGLRPPLARPPVSERGALNVDWQRSRTED
jgi:hypothetical protein